MEPEFSLVIPTYNEAQNIPQIYSQVSAALVKTGIDFEIIFADDNSPDGTGEAVRKLSGQDGRVRLISRVSEKGLGSAVVNGWLNSRGRILGVMDGDLQHPPELLESLLRKIQAENADIAIASRYVSGGGFAPASRIMTIRSRLAVFFCSIFLPKICRKINDPMSGYFLLRKEVILGKTLKPSGFKILLEVLAKGDYKKTIEVPYVFAKRQYGKTKAGLKQYFISFFYLARLKSAKD